MEHINNGYILVLALLLHHWVDCYSERSRGKQATGCFELNVYNKNGSFTHKDGPINIDFICNVNEYANVTEIRYELPQNIRNYCDVTNCKGDICSCCTNKPDSLCKFYQTELLKPITNKCKVEVGNCTASFRREVFNRTRCPKMDYNSDCSKEPEFCYSRWLVVTYSCLSSTVKTSSTASSTMTVMTTTTKATTNLNTDFITTAGGAKPAFTDESRSDELQGSPSTTLWSVIAVLVVIAVTALIILIYCGYRRRKNKREKAALKHNVKGDNTLPVRNNTNDFARPAGRPPSLPPRPNTPLSHRFINKTEETIPKIVEPSPPFTDTNPKQLYDDINTSNTTTSSTFPLLTLDEPDSNHDPESCNEQEDNDDDSGITSEDDAVVQNAPGYLTLLESENNCSKNKLLPTDNIPKKKKENVKTKKKEPSNSNKKNVVDKKISVDNKNSIDKRINANKRNDASKADSSDDGQYQHLGDRDDPEEVYEEIL